MLRWLKALRVSRRTFAGLALCRCGHDRQAHRHYRPGADCSLCGCQRFAR